MDKINDLVVPKNTYFCIEGTEKGIMGFYESKSCLAGERWLWSFGKAEPIWLK